MVLQLVRDEYSLLILKSEDSALRTPLRQLLAAHPLIGGLIQASHIELTVVGGLIDLVKHPKNNSRIVADFETVHSESGTGLEGESRVGFDS